MKSLLLLLFFMVFFFVSLSIAKNILQKNTEKQTVWDKKNEIEKLLNIFSRARIIFPISLFVICSLVSAFYTIGEQEKAIVTTFGVPTVVDGTGIQVKIPFIQKVKKIDTTIQGMPIGYSEKGELPIEEECLMITSDYNFVNIDFYVEYVISDPIQYVYGVEKPVDVFKNVVQSSIRSVVSNYTVDEVLTTGKSQIQSDVMEMVLNDLEEKNIGIALTNVIVQDSEPPTDEVIQAFKAVETAKQQKETKINEAKKYSSEKLPANEADVDKILQEANTQKEKRINEAKQQVALFNAMYEEYVKDKETTKKRMFFETIEDIVPDLNVIIDGTNNLNVFYPFNNTLESSVITDNGGSSNGEEN